MLDNLISNELTLPCGSIIRNRIAKAAMSENMATAQCHPDEKLCALYSRWTDSGAGLLITGNIMVDSRARGEPRNVVVENGRPCPGLEAWAKAATRSNNHFWGQINHPGKQSPRFVSVEPVAPSAIELKPPLNRIFNRPRALTEDEIFDIINRFADTAGLLKNAGFTGVQIHGAHGYLASQFLSPLHNQREDQWGGSLENRARFVRLIYRAIRKTVGPAFPIGIKLNSADFQKGGFTHEESMEVVKMLSGEGVDLIEISGGTYESPEMTGTRRTASSQAREAYFLEYCEEVREVVTTPLMLTGGFRSSHGINAAIASGACEMVGLARSMAINPDFPKQLLSGEEIESKVQPLTTGVRALDRLVPLEVTWYTQQLHRMGNNKNPKPNLSVRRAVLSSVWDLGLQSLKRVRG